MVLLLYSELASYTISCVKELLSRGEKVCIIRWPVNNEAPFEFDFKGIEVKVRDTFDDKQLLEFVKDLNPDIIISSGWMDKGYLKVCKAFYKKIPTVLTLDNHWRGDKKQKLAAIVSPFFLKSRFSHVWVPGTPQETFAKKLRFKEDRIHKGFYSADTKLFQEFFNRFNEKKSKNFPKVIIYLGRYVEHKGIFDMWKAFIEIQKESANEWELWCFGTGDQFDNKLEHPKIKHHGFIQPEALGPFIEKSGVYILPSHFEPWGVSLHEFAAAGFPLLSSKEVGASESFLKDGENGYYFTAGSKNEIKSAMLKMMRLSQDELNVMQKRSFELSKDISTTQWADTLLQIKSEKV